MAIIARLLSGLSRSKRPHSKSIHAPGHLDIEHYDIEALYLTGLQCCRSAVDCLDAEAARF